MEKSKRTGRNWREERERSRRLDKGERRKMAQMGEGRMDEINRRKTESRIRRNPGGRRGRTRKRKGGREG